jgi:hypothetical protein
MYIIKPKNYFSVTVTLGVIMTGLTRGLKSGIFSRSSLGMRVTGISVSIIREI